MPVRPSTGLSDWPLLIVPSWHCPCWPPHSGAQKNSDLRFLLCRTCRGEYFFPISFQVQGGDVIFWIICFEIVRTNSVQMKQNDLTLIYFNKHSQGPKW